MYRPPLRLTERGLYCEPGDFFVDPWRPVDRAVVTHAHADHASRGCGRYLTSRDGERVLRARMDLDATIDTIDYGATLDLGGVRVSLHPAGHILGSAQVRIEHRGRVLVVSGDYKVEPDRTCAPFEPVRVPRLPHRVHLRPAHLPMEARGVAGRRGQRLVAIQSRRGPVEPDLRLRPGESPAHPRRARSLDRADLPPRGRGQARSRLSRDRASTCRRPITRGTLARAPAGPAR